jgi:hypothetical protein
MFCGLVKRKKMAPIASLLGSWYSAVAAEALALNAVTY